MVYGSISWKDYGGNSGTTKIQTPKDLAALQAIATTLQALSNASYVGVRMETPKETPNAPVNATYKLINDKLIFVLQNELRDIFRVSIPAPREEGMIVVNGNHAAAPATITAVVNTMNTNTNNGSLLCVSTGYHSKKTKG